MTAQDRIDPDEYTPGPDSVTAAEEYEPDMSVAEFREADPADVAEQAIEVPVDDGDPMAAEDEEP